MLNKLGDKELSLDILDELKSSGDTIIEGSAAAANILKKAKDEDEEDTTDSIPIDKSFFTNGLKIKDDDFEDVDLKDINTNLKKNNKLIKTILIILGILIVVGGLAIAWTLLD
jgi:CHASE3 domain sensor protein